MGSAIGKFLDSGTKPTTCRRTAIKAASDLWERMTTTVTDMAGSAKDAVKATVRKVDPRPYIDSLKQQAGLAVDHMINLIVVFILQTVLVPMFLLWAMYLALRSSIGKPNPS